MYKPLGGGGGGGSSGRRWFIEGQSSMFVNMETVHKYEACLRVIVGDCSMAESYKW